MRTATPGPRMTANELAGILPVDKPVGPTSHDVVATARRALGMRRIGHTGTLDPFASGLLLLCVGPATRLAEYLSGLPKSYTGTMRLGVVTATDDPEGEILEVNEDWRSLRREQVDRALRSQEGARLQWPPKFSAKKIQGKRAYAIARSGGEVQPEPVPVQIYRAEVTRFDPPEVEFEVDCSTGTYIRAIARDVGKDVGVGAHLTSSPSIGHCRWSRFRTRAPCLIR
jgi:tRNA pseudouridine55 synthase